jgi:hypothetical protein
MMVSLTGNLTKRKTEVLLIVWIHSGLQNIENSQNRDGQDWRDGGWNRCRLALPIAAILDFCVHRFRGGFLVAISTSVLTL